MLDWIIGMRELLLGDKVTTLVRLSVLFLIAVPALFILSRLFKRTMMRHFTSQQAMIISKVTMYAGVTVILLTVLGELGFDLTSLLGAAGIAGIAIAFAAQTSVSNIISGLFLIAEKPFEVDDLITVGGTTGIVLAVDLLSVKIRTFDNKFVRIPNETIIKSEVANITRFPIRRIDIAVGVAYKEDLERVRTLLLDLARKHPQVLNEPEPLVIFKGYGDSSLDILFAIWCVKTDFLTVRNDMIYQLKKTLDENDIEIPFPHLSLYAGSATTPLPLSMVGGNLKENSEK